MTEHKLFEGDVPYVSTAEFHADRERAPHLEQSWHQPRLFRAADFVRESAQGSPGRLWSVSDLGCGDGGLLSLVKDMTDVRTCWGYDFAPANAAGWVERDVQAQALDVFGKDRDAVALGDIVVMTEVLEHVADPRGVLLWLKQQHVRRLVCSSPWNETPQYHSPEHAWAWDMAGYAAMFGQAGWTVNRHEQVGLFQVVLAS